MVRAFADPVQLGEIGSAIVRFIVSRGRDSYDHRNATANSTVGQLALTRLRFSDVLRRDVHVAPDPRV